MASLSVKWGGQGLLGSWKQLHADVERERHTGWHGDGCSGNVNQPRR